MPKTRLMPRLMLPLAMLPLAGGCVTPTPIIAEKAPCSTLVPQVLRSQTHGAPPPARLEAPQSAADGAWRVYLDSLAREWQKFGVAQTAQLSISDDKREVALGIIERCETRDREAVRAARPKLLGIF